MKTLSPGFAQQYPNQYVNNCAKTAIAVNAGGNVILVFARSYGIDSRPMSYAYGYIKYGSVIWTDSVIDSWDTGVTPCVSMNNNNIISVHESDGWSSNLWYRAGSPAKGMANWTGGSANIFTASDKSDYASGSNPAVCVGSSGNVILVYTNDGLQYATGNMNSGTSWNYLSQYSGNTFDSDGDYASVTILQDGTILVVYVRGDNDLYYVSGTLQSNNTIKWGTPQSFSTGYSPSVTVLQDGKVSVAYSGMQQNGPNLVIRTGAFSNGLITWDTNNALNPTPNQTDAQYDNGTSPSIFSAGQYFVHSNNNWYGDPAQNIIVPGYAASLYMDRTSWMTNTNGLKNLPLYQITLPGTHDSGTANFSDVRVCDNCSDWTGVNPLNIVQAFGQAQSGEMLWQIRNGARAIDFRVYKDADGGFYTYHGYEDLPLSTHLANIATFMSTAAQNELVILDFSGFCSYDSTKPFLPNFSVSDYANIISTINSNIGKYLYQGKMDATTIVNATLETLTANGPTIIVIFEGQGWDNNGKWVNYIDEYPSPGMISSLNITDQYSNSDSYTYMISDTPPSGQNNSIPGGQLYYYQNDYGQSGSLFLLSWLLTLQDASDVINYSGLRALAAVANPYLGDFCAKNLALNEYINILRSDYMQDSRCVDIAQMINNAVIANS